MKTTVKIQIKTVLLIGLLLFLIISQTACGQKPLGDADSPQVYKDPVRKENYLLDTICQVQIYALAATADQKPEQILDGVFALISDYEAMLSKTKEGSDIYKINHAGGAPVSCHPETLDLIRRSIEFGDLSQGFFDVTMGRVTDLWDFQSDHPQTPGEEELQEALRHVDYHQIQIEGDTVRLTDPMGELDLGGIAKGFIGDRAAAYLKDQGVTGAIVDLGGNISVVGYKDGVGEAFRVGIQKPFSDRGEVLGAISCHDESIVTSGVYERYYKRDGKLYHHILRVDTGMPAETGLNAVTIEGKGLSGRDADALATICILLGKEKALALIESMDGFEAMAVDTDGRIDKTSGFQLESAS